MFKKIEGIKCYTGKYSLSGNESPKAGREEWKNDMRHTENKNYNGRHRPNCISNTIKHDWIKQFGIKAEIVRLNKQTRSNNMLPIVNTALDSKIQKG